LAIDKLFHFPKPSLPVIKRVLTHFAAPFALVCFWKIALVAFFVLPPPANDSFFYDGPVVNFLLYGKYANPSLAVALPISGTEVFSAYPPLYQAVLLGWIFLFSTAAVSAMVLHLVLFGLYLLLLAGLLRRMGVVSWSKRPGGSVGLYGVCGVAALFALGITFHDRPDSLAHVFGLGALYSWLRSRGLRAEHAETTNVTAVKPCRRWLWTMAACSILTFATGVQLGAVYCLLIGLALFGDTFVNGRPFPWGPALLMVLGPVLLVALVGFGFPRLWSGFLEHVHQTPSYTGPRLPRLDELLKAVRTLPGVLGAAIVLGVGSRTFLSARRSSAGPRSEQGAEPSFCRDLFFLTFVCTFPALAVTLAAMFLLTPNSVLFAQYLQPLSVAGCLVLCLRCDWGRGRANLVRWLFFGLGCVAAIRAVGLSTWGVACAVDVPYSAAMRVVDSELRAVPGKTVILSSALLYRAANHCQVRSIHSDWMQGLGREHTATDWKGLLELKPAKLVLTQFDYYRRYAPVVERLGEHPELASLEIRNFAHVRAPDSFPLFRRVLQHVSWAPIVVSLDWKY
jgi:hypothetical protein